VLVVNGGYAQSPAVSSAPDSSRKALSPAQPTKKPAVKKPKPIANEFSMGLRLNTNGWSLFAERGLVRTDETKYRDQFHHVDLAYLELSEQKHPKETRSTINGDPQRTRPFVFGKVHNFYKLKAGVARRRMIAGKPESGTVSVHWVYGGGVAAGLLKPYYVEALVANSSTGRYEQQTIRYSEETKGSFLNEGFILGAAGFVRGLNEVKFVPGISARTGLHFDFSQRKRTKMAVEVGMNTEVYTKAIELMANQKARPYAVNVYASIQAGKRW
jgi:hypothetical protein